VFATRLRNRDKARSRCVIDSCVIATIKTNDDFSDRGLADRWRSNHELQVKTQHDAEGEQPGLGGPGDGGEPSLR
jgi:hypothetical protein